MKIVIVFLSLFVVLSSFAQQHDHEDSLRTDSAVVCFSAADNYLHFQLDSSILIHDLNHFNRFDPLANLQFYNYNGVMGGIYQPQYFPDKTTPSFFDFFNEQSIYNFDFKKLNFFHNDVAFTRASYSSGYKKSQYFDIVHAQPIAKQWNLNLEYRLLGSPGAYKNQQTKHAHFRGLIQFRGDSSLYHAFAGFTQNNIFRKENAGIAENTIFLDTNVYDRQLAKVNLYNAQYRYKKTEYFLRHGLNLGGKNIDKNSIFVEHEFLLSHKHNVFADSDPTNPFYLYAIDSTSTHDSIRHREISNSLLFGNRNNKSFSWFAKSGYSLHKIYNSLNDSTLSELFAEAALKYSILKTYNISVFGKMSAIDSNTPDILLEVAFNSSDSIKFRPFGKVSFTNFNPSVFYNNYHGNNVEINFSSLSTKILFAEVGLNYGNHNLVIYGKRFSEMMYFTKTSVKQGGLGIAYGAKYRGMVNFGRFTFLLNAMCQDVRNAQYVRVPKWSAYARLSMHNKVFGKALNLHSGFEFSVSEKYYADAYDPLRQVFYMQNDLKTGGFFYPGVFIEAQIKRMCIFVEAQNFLAGVTTVDYWQIPYYPLSDFAFRFGLSWTFFN